MGLIALLHRLGLEYHKPNVIARKELSPNLGDGSGQAAAD
jgi:hypothetical protein